MKTRSNRMTLTLLTAAAAVVMMVGGARQAMAFDCENDDDCPNMACGGQVCDWNQGRICRDAGKDAQGVDGWCTTDDDCKCKGMGATCKYPYCTITKPEASATGGASGTGTGGSTGTATGGSTGTATGGSSGAGTGGASSGSKGDSGGCSVAGTPGASSLSLGGLALLGLALIRRRARR